MSDWHDEDDDGRPEDIDLPFPHPWIEEPYFFDTIDVDAPPLSTAMLNALLAEAEAIRELIPELAVDELVMMPYLSIEATEGVEHDVSDGVHLDLTQSEFLEVDHSVWVWIGRDGNGPPGGALLQMEFSAPGDTEVRQVTFVFSPIGLSRCLTNDEEDIFSQIVSEEGLDRVSEPVAALLFRGLQWYRKVLEIEAGRWPCRHN